MVLNLTANPPKLRLEREQRAMTSLFTLVERAQDTLGLLASVIVLVILVFVWRVLPRLVDRYPDIVDARTRRMVARHRLRPATVPVRRGTKTRRRPGKLA
jgi:hypothetical protein